MAKEVPITDATVEIYKKDGSSVGNASHEGGGDYLKTNLDEGEYYFIATAPGRGTVVKDFTLPEPNNIEEVLKNISVQMFEGVDNVSVELIDKEGGDVSAGVTVKIARVELSHTTGKTYTADNLPKGLQLFEVIPDDSEYMNYQHYKEVRNIEDDTVIQHTIYPPVNVRIRPTSATSGTEVPGARVFLTKAAGGEIDESTEVFKQNGQFWLTDQADKNIWITITAPEHKTRSVERNISYESSTEGYQTISIQLERED